MKFARAITVTILLAATPAMAQTPGERTASPEQVLAQLESGETDPAADPQMAEAARHPLGSIDNPVRVGGPEGERAYLARLRCSNGVAPRIGMQISGGPGAFGSVVDLFPLDCGTAAPGKAEIAMDKYHEEHVEAAAPAGFTLAR